MNQKINKKNESRSDAYQEVGGKESTSKSTRRWIRVHRSKDSGPRTSDERKNLYKVRSY